MRVLQSTPAKRFSKRYGILRLYDVWKKPGACKKVANSELQNAKAHRISAGFDEHFLVNFAQGLYVGNNLGSPIWNRGNGVGRVGYTLRLRRLWANMRPPSVAFGHGICGI